MIHCAIRNSTTSHRDWWVLVLCQHSILWLEVKSYRFKSFTESLFDDSFITSNPSLNFYSRSYSAGLFLRKLSSTFLVYFVFVDIIQVLTICISTHAFAVNPDGDLITQNGYLLVNNVCALAGYYCAAYVIDKPRIGRKKLQECSNIACMIIFLVAGGIFNSAGPSVLMFLYFLSSFTVNFGPNVTTYVMAAETYPTELRATLHGSEYFSL
jgi:hypothetical protein